MRVAISGRRQTPSLGHRATPGLAVAPVAVARVPAWRQRQQQLQALRTAHHLQRWHRATRQLPKPSVCIPAASSVTAAASAGPLVPEDDEAVLATPPGYRPPVALPPPPSQATLVQVLPWLLRLAFGEPQLRWRLGAAMVLLLASKAAGLSAPFYFKQAVDALAAGGSTAAALHAAAFALLLSGGCRVVAGLAKELQGPIFAPVSQDAGRRVAFYTFAHVLGLGLQFHLNRKTGALSRMLERGARSVAMIFRAIVFTFVPTALELAAVCVILARAFHPRVSALVLATFACYAAYTVALTWVAAGIRRRVKELDNEITGKAVDALLNFETVKLFDNGTLEVRQYDTSLTAYQRSVVRLDYAAAALNAGQAFILAAGMTGVMLAAALTPGVVTGAAGAAAGAITAGDLVMIQGLLLQLWAPLQFLGWFYRELRQSLVDMEDLFTLLRTPSRLPEGGRELPAAPLADTHGADAAPAPGASLNGSGAAQQPGAPSAPAAAAAAAEEALGERRCSNGAASTSGSSGNRSAASSSSSAPSRRGLRLELRDARFGYGGKEGRQVLKGVSLVAEPGESIAIVGPSGSGKSTMLRLLVRLYDCDEGQVLLNGVDVRELRQDSLRAAVAVVPQDTVLFNDTILHNVAYGQPGASMAAVRAAASAAKLDAAVVRMPAGWGTVVGERGLKLSGGEKQRVAIARAFLRQPRLLICDEATSALDTATERGIQASLHADPMATSSNSVYCKQFCFQPWTRPPSAASRPRCGSWRPAAPPCLWRTACPPCRPATAFMCCRMARWRSRARTRSSWRCAVCTGRCGTCSWQSRSWKGTCTQERGTTAHHPQHSNSSRRCRAISSGGLRSWLATAAAAVRTRADCPGRRMRLQAFANGDARARVARTETQPNSHQTHECPGAGQLLTPRSRFLSVSGHAPNPADFIMLSCRCFTSLIIDDFVHEKCSTAGLVRLQQVPRETEA